jgi:flagellar biosynthesis GTPase FlhF
MTMAFVTPVLANVPPAEEVAAQEETEVTASRIGDDINKDSMPPDEVTGADGQAAENENQPLTPEGNMSIVDDIVTDGGKQFITLTTRSGHYYYLIIDRASSSEQNVYFLNQVDERDLISSMSEADRQELKKTEEEAAAKAAEEEAKKQAEEAAKKAAEEAAKAKEEEAAAAASADSRQKQAEPSIRIGNMQIPLKAAIIASAGAAVLFISLFIIAMRKHKASKAPAPDPDAGYEDSYDDEYVLEEEEEDDGE